MKTLDNYNLDTELAKFLAKQLKSYLTDADKVVDLDCEFNEVTINDERKPLRKAIQDIIDKLEAYEKETTTPAEDLEKFNEITIAIHELADVFTKLWI